MMLTLAWLTISLPFVYADQQAQKEITQKQCSTQPEKDSSNPLANTTEEKTGNVNTLAEYLHDAADTEHYAVIITTQYDSHSSDTYLAFHPELICPPPDVSAS